MLQRKTDILFLYFFQHSMVGSVELVQYQYTSTSCCDCWKSCNQLRMFPTSLTLNINNQEDFLF